MTSWYVFSSYKFTLKYGDDCIFVRINGFMFIVFSFPQHVSVLLGAMLDYLTNNTWK